MRVNEADLPQVPVGLGERGRQFWVDTWADYELTDSEAVLLEEACRVLDRLDGLDATIRREGMTTVGSTGQSVIHPAIQEARQQQVVLHRLIAALSLPDEEGDSVLSAGQVRSQVANRVRWAGVDTEAARVRRGDLVG